MKKTGLTPINQRAKRLDQVSDQASDQASDQDSGQDRDKEVFGLEEAPIFTSMPVGCTTIFDTGWETNPRPSTPIGNCLSSARDFSGCSGACWWPAQTPDWITNYPNWQNQCAAIERDWRNLNFIIKR